MHSLVLAWAGGEHPFRLRLGELEGLQQKTDCGPEFLLNKINFGQWSVTDLFETIRFGLIDSGMADGEAVKLTRNTFERHPLIDFKIPAQAILGAALYGPPDDVVGENGPVAAAPGKQKTADGNSADFTG